MSDLVRTADKKKMFWKSDATNCSYKLYKITQNFVDTKPSYCIENLPESFNEASLKMSELSMTEIKDIMKALNLN